ncbi:MAG: sulfite exporter TauE/SafE family protein [Phycisphaeraceae bacterium]|nr:sulfite exporter TauE/SafE family protein [Phycisphaeraceae bacterium]
MDVLQFTFVAFVTAIAAGVLGSWLGLGGGIIIVPALTILLKVDIRFAIGASLVSVIATSSGAGAAYVKEHMANLRLGMFLELATALGALLGAFLAGLIATQWLYVIFGSMMAYTAIAMWRHQGPSAHAALPVDHLSQRLALQGSYFDRSVGTDIHYPVHRSRTGFALSGLAGLLSGLLGVGGGIVKVPTMNLMMGVPLKAATSTSNFMMGVTAAASAGVYFARGDIDPFVAAPVAMGVMIGATVGSRFLSGLRSSWMRLLFTVVLVVVAVQMLLKGLR